ncbi:MAG: thioredoxin family protein [Chitinophagales bacterium]
MKSIFILSVFVFYLFTVLPQRIAAQNTIDFFEGDLETLFATAKKQNKAIFIDTYTDWCLPCKKMETEVFPRPDVHIFYNNFFINYKLNMFSEEGIAFAKKHKINTYPTYLYFNADGSLNHTVIGAKIPQKFIEAGKIGAVNQKKLAEMTFMYKKGNTSKSFMAEFLTLLWLSNDPLYPILVKKYCVSTTSADLQEEIHQQTIYSLANDLTQNSYQLFANHKTLFEEKFGVEQVKNKQLAAAYNSLEIAIQQKNYALFNDIITIIRTFQTPKTNESLLTISLQFYEAMKDWTTYAETACTFLPKVKITNAADLNNIAWNFYEQIDNIDFLEIALKWAAQSIELDNQPYNNDTYKSLLTKLGSHRS